MDTDRLTGWILTLHLSALRALRQAGIQGSDDDVDDYADEIDTFADVCGLVIPPGTDPQIDRRRKERRP
jgi:hypothetical protein